MRSFFGVIPILSTLVFLLSCTQNVQIRNSQSDMISGSIEGLGSSSLSKVKSKIGALASCNQTEVQLYRLTEQGEVGELVAETTIDQEGKFLFKSLSEKGVIISNVATSTPSYVLRFMCDTEVLSRFVTGSSLQNIDFGTTMLSWFSQIASSEKVLSVQVSKWNELYTSLAGSNSVEQVYQRLTNNVNVRNKVEEVGLLPSELSNAYPVIRSFIAPTSFNEEAPNLLNALVHHWNPNYDFAYEWRLNGQLLSNSHNYNYVPGANSQGDYTLQLFVGKNNGSGLVDTASPYIHKVVDVKINNSVLPSVPGLSLLSNSQTNSTAAQIRLATGAVSGSTFANCRSFSQFAIVEDLALSVALPPAMFSDFSHTCTTANNQDVSVTLSGTPGPRVIRVWTMDAAGVVSLVPQEVSLEYDITAPIISISSPVANTEAQSGVTLSGACETGLAVTISGTGVSGTSTACAAGTFSTAVSFTAGEGTKAVQVSQTDAAGNSSSDTRNFVRDTIAPVVAITSPAAGTTAQDEISLSGTCESGLNVTIGGSGATATSAMCVSGAFSSLVSFSNGDGTKTFQVSQVDAAGNSSSHSRNFIRDTTAPAVTISGPAVNSVTQDQITLTGSCEAGLTVSVSGTGATATSTACAAGTFSVAVHLTAGDGTKNVVASQTDGVGNTGTASRNFIRDSTAPALSFLQINTGEAVTGNRNVVLSMAASSDRVDIQSFCVKMNDSVAPLAGDSCWTDLTSVALTVTDNLVLNNYPFQVGSLLSTYTLRVWLKDQIGNISSNADVSGIDTAAIYYEPDPPPVIASLTVTSGDVVNQPLTESDTIALLGADIYVKWSVTDNHPIPNGKISLHYTTDEVNFTPLQVGLNNGVNGGGCTLDPGTTGCVRLSAASPLNTYYKVQITVEDSGSFKALSASNPLNTGKFTVLSGNTSLGIGGSASSAILQGRYETTDNVDTHAFVVTKKGDIFFSYNVLGLAHVSPVTGVISIIARDTNSSTGDGGPLSAATVDNIHRLMLDYDDNLVIWDGLAVRRVDLSSPNWTISRVFGGGANTSSGAAALSAQLQSPGNNRLFTILPNGRMYYEKGREVWYYDPADSTVKLHLTLSGMGLGDMAGALANFDWAACDSNNTAITYDKATSSVTKIIRRGVQSPNASCTSHPNNEGSRNANFNLSTGLTQTPHPPNTSWSSVNFTGMDGRLYSINSGRSQLLRYEPGTNTIVKILGTNDLGRCADGVLATSCPVNVASAFVNEFGKVYFLDLGVIRTIDEAGYVRTVVGQPRNFGAGENPASARYSLVNFFDVVGDDVYVLNKTENQIMKFSLTGGVLEHIAGNGVAAAPWHNAVAVTSPLHNGQWTQPVGFRVDPGSNRLYYRSHDKFSYLNLTTGLWHVSSSIILASSSRPSYLALAPDRLLAYVQVHYGASGNRVTLSEVDFSGNNTVVYGQDAILTSLSSDLCDNAVATTCTLSATLNNFAVQTRAKYDSVMNAWIIGYYGKNYLNVLPLGGGTTNRLEIAARGIWAYDTAYSGPDMMLYYCGNNGRLYKRNTTTDVETELTLPSSTITCNGQSLHYHAGRNSLIFVYKQNDLYGVAEYKDP